MGRPVIEAVGGGDNQVGRDQRARTRDDAAAVDQPGGVGPSTTVDGFAADDGRGPRADRAGTRGPGAGQRGEQYQGCAHRLS